MRLIEPQAFWDEFREALRVNGTVSAYHSNVGWTRVATDAAAKACIRLGMLVHKEYLKVDLLGYSNRSVGDAYDWDWHVAFEHENNVQAGCDWCDELCKLVHVVADLRVLVGYRDPRNGSIADTLQQRIYQMGDRMLRVQDGKWLFAFGPSYAYPDAAYEAFTLDPNLQLKRLEDEAPLIPAHFPAP